MHGPTTARMALSCAPFCSMAAIAGLCVIGAGVLLYVFTPSLTHAADVAEVKGTMATHTAVQVKTEAATVKALGDIQTTLKELKTTVQGVKTSTTILMRDNGISAREEARRRAILEPSP